MKCIFIKSNPVPYPSNFSSVSFHSQISFNLIKTHYSVTSYIIMPSNINIQFILKIYYLYKKEKKKLRIKNHERKRLLVKFICFFFLFLFLLEFFFRA